jgi:microcystin-dependent protein
MPQVQDRRRSEREELISQSVQHRGGFVVYSGMNDQGDFYIGKLKIEAGSSEITSIIPPRGDNTTVESAAFPTDATFNSVTVNSSLQSNADTEVIDLLLRGNRSGDVGKSVYVGIKDGDTTPTSNVDSILFRTSFGSGGYLGWVRTTGGWRRFGPISKSATAENYEIDQLEVTGDTTLTDTTVNGDITQSGNVSTSGIVTATTFVGNGITPIGGIIIWSGATNAVPGGWSLCDGSNGTPDLRERFVVGAGGDNSTVAGSTGYAVNATGGSNDAVLVSHDHTATSTSTSTVTDPGHAHTFDSHNDDNNDGNTLNDRSNNPNQQTMTSSSETTGITVATVTTTTISTEGESGDNKNLPPYYALAYIMRTT